MRTYGVSGSFSKTIDVDVIKRYNEEIAKTPNAITAYYRALSDGNGNIIQCNKATRDLIASQNGAAVSAKALKEAQDAASKSGSKFAGVAKTLKGVLANFAIMWLIEGIIKVVQLVQREFFPTTKQLSEQLNETANTIKSNNDEIKSLNDELQTTQSRINELKSKGKLSFTEASELKELEKQNAALRDKIDLLEVANQKEQLDATRDFKKLAGTKYGTWESRLIMGDKSDIEEITRFIKEGISPEYVEANFKKYSDALDDLLVTGVDYEKADEETKKYIDSIYKMRDAYLVANGQAENLFDSIINRDRFSEARTEIEKLANAGNLTAESLQNLYNQGGNVKEFINYLLSLNTIDWKTVLGEDAFNNLDVDKNGVISQLELFDETTGECKLSTEQWAKVMPLLSNELNKVEDAADEAETSFKSIAKTLSDGLDKLSNKKDILSKVKEELDSFGAISADNISKILEQFSDNDDVQKAVSYYLSGLGTAQQVYDAMAKGYKDSLKLQAENLATQMQNDENYYKSLAKLHGDFLNFKVGNYTIDISNEKNLATAKLKIENNLIETLKTNWSSLYQIQGKNLAQLEKYAREQVAKAPGSIERRLAQDFLSDVLSQKRIYDNAVNEFNNLALKGFNSAGFNASLSTDFSGNNKSGKTEAEKYFEKLKYQLETNQITQERYLKDLDWGYKQFYNKTADYLEDYAKYSQEVYDGFKDMYKEDLEAQKEAWEEKKDAVSEYYDNLREQIENSHDEEDYEKEQSEKRKEIFDLDMQIAELMRDGSEKAKARIAELEEERLKAEEELRDFETDKVREDELSRLEKEQKAEEDKIQQQIDKIDGDLKSIDENITKARQDIINYAKAKGVILDFAHASGTRSSPGGFGRINEKGIEMISAPDGNGNYIPMLPNSYVFSAKATEFLWKLATEHSLPQAMYNSIAKSIKTQSNTPSVNIAQPITITMGDVIIKGNADKQTVADIKRQQDNTVRMVLQRIKELQK